MHPDAQLPVEIRRSNPAPGLRINQRLACQVHNVRLIAVSLGDFIYGAIFGHLILRLRIGASQQQFDQQDGGQRENEAPSRHQRASQCQSARCRLAPVITVAVKTAPNGGGQNNSANQDEK